MEDYWFLILIAGFVAWGIISWIREAFADAKKYHDLKPKLDSLNAQIETHAQQIKEDNKELDKKMQKLGEAKNSAKRDLDKIAAQKTMGFPWLAEAYAEYFALRDLKRENYLENKKHPALTAAQTVREIKAEKKELLNENKLVTYKLNYFENLFPWLSELISEDEEEIVPVRMDVDSATEGNGDRVKDFLTPEEYKSLPSVERNQMALDRYLKNRNKSKWAIGRDYEMYTGYLYEQQGYSIEYKGIIDGFDDLGRDVIATKDGEVCIIQCKYWAQYKEIHEKHVFQLFGTTMEYWIKNFSNHHKPKNFEEFAKFLNEHKLRPIFFTSTKLSDRSKEMAEALSIEVKENEPIGDYPRIKCNINKDEFGNETKIYHLPIDQQYDRTIIGNRPGEFHAFTVQEAEDAGFRRAFKHRI